MRPLEELERIQREMPLIVEHGRHAIIALAIIVLGLITVKWLNKTLKKSLSRLPLTHTQASVVRNIICIIIIAIVAVMAAIVVGLPPRPVLQFLTIISLSAMGIIAVFRPLIPTLPFKVGNTVKAGDLLGKVEAITILNTRLKTFDGTTVFVPNRKILDDIVINYHFTPTRKFKLEINILYDEDLMKAKQIMETIMVEDPRVHPTPRPVVYLMSLNKGYVELSGRGWTNNLDRFVVNRELLERIKLRFDQEGITLALPQMQVHYTGKNKPPSYMEG